MLEILSMGLPKSASPRGRPAGRSTSAGRARQVRRQEERQMSITDIADTVQDQVFEAVKAAQDAVVEAVRNLADTVERLVPEGGRATVAERLPDTGKIVDRAFGFAERLLEAQHEFVSRLVEAAAPARPAGTTTTATTRKATAA